MEFDRQRVYTPFNCDEIKIGSKGFVADNKSKLVNTVERSDGQDWAELKNIDTNCNLPFIVTIGYSTCHYEFFYLVEEPKEPVKRSCTRKELLEMLKRQQIPMVLRKDNGFTYSIIRLNDEGITVISVIGSHLTYDYSELCNTFTLLDGTPLWVKE